MRRRLRKGIGRQRSNFQKWFLASIPDQYNKENYSGRTKFYLIKRTYQGDRFVPCRRGYNFDQAHYLLTKESENNNNHDYMLDVCKQVNMMNITYQRKIIQLLMSQQTFISGLNQKRILHFNISAAQSATTNPPNLENIGKWKCVPRKRPLIGNMEKVFSLDDFSNSENETNTVIDLSCNGLISVSKRNCMKVYNSQNELLSTWFDSGGPINVIKWSNDGSKIAMASKDRSSKLILYDLKQRFLWSRVCYCVFRPLNLGPDDTRKRCITIRCICWSPEDRLIITGCDNLITICMLKATVLYVVAINSVLTMNLSPNFKYLAVTTEDSYCHVFFWPEMIPHMQTCFCNTVKAIAWHPETPGLLCIGTTDTGSLVMCDVIKKTLPYFVNTRFHGSVKHLLWNKLSGELLVHWNYKERDKQYTVVPILARFDRIIDALPLDKETQPTFITFNATHEKLLILFNDDTIAIWNFFGDQKWQDNSKSKITGVSFYNSAKRKQGILNFNPIR